MASTTVRTPNSYVKENSASDMVWKPDSAYPSSNSSSTPTSTRENNSTWSDRNKRDPTSTPREPLRSTVSLLNKYTTKPKGNTLYVGHDRSLSYLSSADNTRNSSRADSEHTRFAESIFRDSGYVSLEERPARLTQSYEPSFAQRTPRTGSEMGSISPISRIGGGKPPGKQMGRLRKGPAGLRTITPKKDHEILEALVPSIEAPPVNRQEPAKESANDKDANRRDSKRASRSRPWNEKPAQSLARSSKYKLEVHYEKCLPEDTWLQMKPLWYAKNHKYGQAYKVRKPQAGKPFKPETEDWLHENDYRIWLLEKGQEKKQLNFPAKQNRYILNENADKGKNNVGNIVAHRDVYENYHAQKVLRERKKQNAIKIQKIVRGWLTRIRLKNLKNRVNLRHGSNWERFVKEYKLLLTRVQKRYGVLKSKASFDLCQVRDFLNRKEKYEKVFYDLSIGDKLPRHLLRPYFIQCGLKPTSKTISTAFQAINTGCNSRSEVVFVVDCAAGVADASFHLQSELIKSIIRTLHVGDNNVRVGYVPYNTDVFQPFALEQCETRDDVLRAIDHVKYQPGIMRADLALKKMRETFKTAREGVPKVAIIISEGGATYNRITERQIQEANKDLVLTLSVGVGKNPDEKNLAFLATDPGHVFRLSDIYDVVPLQKEMCKKASLMNCLYCDYAPLEELQQTGDRGLYKSEVLELLWMIFPPEATGMDPVTRSDWMKTPAQQGQKPKDKKPHKATGTTKKKKVPTATLR